MNKSEIKIFQVEDGNTEVEVKIDRESVWLSQKQMSALFEKDTDTIGLHLKNIFKSGELEEDATTEESSVVQKEGNRTVKRTIKFYNLDAIISVGYRVNSKRGTQFRIWANKVLKQYLIDGYSINERLLARENKQLKELQDAAKMLADVLNYTKLSDDESEGLIRIISDYAYALEILDQYDYQSLKIDRITRDEIYRLTYEEAIDQINKARAKLKSGDLFGKEKDESFKSSISTIYQSFDGRDLYPSIEEKAANLLYFITKNHSFVDGNKRIAAMMFLYFLERNNILYASSGEKRIADNALVALTLMIAVSKPEEKDTIVTVIVNLINKSN